MKNWISALLLAGLIYACGQTGNESAAATEDQTAAAPQPEAPAPDGEKIYKQNCVVCHGIYGDMGASGAFNLTQSALPVEERVNVITNGRNAMTPFKTLLSPEQIQAVAAYTLKLKKEG